MDQMIHEYNTCVKSAVRKVRYEFVFAVAGVGLGLAGALLNPLAVGGALVSLVRFATLDRKPVVQAGENSPAAMFHDVRSVFG